MSNVLVKYPDRNDSKFALKEHMTMIITLNFWTNSIKAFRLEKTQFSFESEPNPSYLQARVEALEQVWRQVNDVDIPWIESTDRLEDGLDPISVRCLEIKKFVEDR